MCELLVLAESIPEFDAHEAHVGNEIRRAPGRINAGKERLEREKKAIQYVQKYTGDIWS